MTTFLFGANSMLGWSMFRAQPTVVPFCNGFTKAPPPEIERGIHLDDELAVSQLFAAETPDLIVHAAGVCDVGGGKSTGDGDVDRVYSTFNVAQFARERGKQ